jgi:outer membrane immunogenic protein
MNNIFDNDTSYSSIGTFGTVRGRFGYALDNLLFYATAGLAYASITNDIQKGRNAGEQIVWDNQWTTGYAIGGGLEYGFTQSLIGRLEYIYSNYGTTSLRNADGNLAELMNEMHLFRAGVSYKF